MSDSKETKTNGNTTTGYHLFFEPENSLRGELQEIITKLADENHAPSFPPHVTLLAEIPAEPIEALQEKAQKLASMLSPLELTLGELDADGNYFRALYISIKELPEISMYYKHALAVFGMKDAAQNEQKNEEGYTPHLSLLYGNYAPEEIEHIRANLTYPRGVNFTVRKIHLYKTEGEVSKWKKVAEFPLH